jgi:hypothetical protein
VLGASLKRCVALEELRLAHNQLSVWLLLFALVEQAFGSNDADLEATSDLTVVDSYLFHQDLPKEIE